MAKRAKITTTAATEDAATIKFNVGGRQFEVSQSLMDPYADTMLGRLISETWLKDPQKTIFIDRSGDIFFFVLEYLRYGSIELPVNMPKSMFDREMDYYGISVDKENVKQDTPQQRQKIISERVLAAKDELKKAQRDQDMFIIANFIQFQFLTGLQWMTVNHLKQVSQKLHDKDYLKKNDIYYDDLDLINEHLENHHGLRVVKKMKNRGEGLGFEVEEVTEVPEVEE